MNYYLISANGKTRLARSDGPPQETWNAEYCSVCGRDCYLSEPIEVLSPTGDWVQERLCTEHNAVARISDREVQAYMSQESPRIPR